MGGGGGSWEPIKRREPGRPQPRSHHPPRGSSGTGSSAPGPVSVRGEGGGGSGRDSVFRCRGAGVAPGPCPGPCVSPRFFPRAPGHAVGGRVGPRPRVPPGSPGHGDSPVPKCPAQRVGGGGGRTALVPASPVSAQGIGTPPVPTFPASQGAGTALSPCPLGASLIPHSLLCPLPPQGGDSRDIILPVPSRMRTLHPPGLLGGSVGSWGPGGLGEGGQSPPLLPACPGGSGRCRDTRGKGPRWQPHRHRHGGRPWGRQPRVPTGGTAW